MGINYYLFGLLFLLLDFYSRFYFKDSYDEYIFEIVKRLDMIVVSVE
jgi:hypothetical protein